MRRIIHFLIILSLALPAAAIAAPELESDDDKIIYVMGIMVGRNVPPLGLSEREVEIMMRGASDQLVGREPAIDATEYGPQLKAFMEARVAALAIEERNASSDFVKEAAAVKGARTTESGLIYLDVSEGSGEQPAVTDSVTVHYTGTLRDGSVFDSSYTRGEPASFALNRVIPCWTEALQRMKAGGKATIVCPADIAYGDRGAPGGLIKPGAALKFEVELLSIDQ
jgi:FKBP-type peptidyl-prolyl cis-trans isomerase FkpA